MYRAMVRVMFHDMWTNLMKKKSDFFMSLFMLSIFVYQAVSIYLEYGNLQNQFAFSCVSLVYLLVLHMMLGKMPIRVSQAMYICPVDENGRVKYLCFQLAFKTGLMLLLLGIALKLTCGKLFVVRNIRFNFMQAVLCFFFCIYLNLLNGIFTLETKDVDEKGYRVQSKAEKGMGIWGTCIYVLEWTFLLTSDMWGISQIAIFVIGIVFVGINLFLTVKYTKPLLLEISSYEKVYCKKPKQEAVQYDL